MRQATLPCWLLACAIGMLSGCAGLPVASDIPHMEQRDGMKKLIVDGRPYICVAGEVANTSSSDPATMKQTIARLSKANLNTILTVVSWDLVEPQEGQFDFSWVDYQIEAARANNIRLIFLWMASWKNGLSHFPPEWVKANQARFPRVVNGQGHSLEILSTLSEENRNADARAFAAVQKHIREVDKDHTVIGWQIENEVGVMGSVRDFCPAANKAFAEPVPAELMNYLVAHKDNLLPEFKKIWVDAGSKTSGTWEEVFGKSVPRTDVPVPNSPSRTARGNAELVNHAEEIFMAWNYSRYMGYVAQQGKNEYSLPMYVNTWIVQPNDRGPGDYPSGGPEALVHDVWRAGAPAIDILAPDIYLPTYAQVIQQFARNGNPAFNPETSQNAANCWMAFTQLNSLCFSPFGIDGLSPDSAWARTYGFINSISGAIAEAQGQKDAIKLIQLTPGQTPGKVEMGNYILDFTPTPGSRTGTGRATAAAAASRPAGGGGGAATLSFLDAPFVLIINTAPDEYYFATNDVFPFRVSVSPKIGGNKIAAPATIDRGTFSNGKWILSHRLNGDDIMGIGYDLSGAAANRQAGTEIPLGSRGRWNAPWSPNDAPSVWHVTFYQYQ